MRALLLSIAVVACSGAYMGLTTRAPQQLTLAAPLSQRTAPAVAVFSTRKRKVTRPPVRQIKINIILPFAQEWLIILPLNVLIFQALFNLWSTYLASINVFDVPYQLHLCWEVSVLCLDQLP